MAPPDRRRRHPSAPSPAPERGPLPQDVRRRGRSRGSALDAGGGPLLAVETALPADLRAVLPDGRLGLAPSELAAVGEVIDAALMECRPGAVQDAVAWLAERIGCSPQTVRKLIKGRSASRALAVRAAEVLGCQGAVRAVLRGDDLPGYRSEARSWIELRDAAGAVWRIQRIDEGDRDTI